MATAPMAPTTTKDTFVGRTDEIQQIRDWLSDGRLVTVVGLPGAGKTRLVRELASDPEFAGEVSSVFFCDFSDARGAADVVARVAELWDVTLEGQTSEERNSALVKAMREQPEAVVILDNFETVLDAAPLVSQWSQELPHRFLVTSTTTLDVRGEHVHALSALRADEATQLFVARAFTERGRRPADADVDAARRIAERLDGLPLAIELAARQVDVFDTPELEAQLDRAFDLLSTGPRDAPERHRSLRAMVNWGWGQLDDQERRVMQAASVFEGGVRHDALAAVLGLELSEVAALTLRLSRKSMLTVDRQATGSRLVMLKTLATFARRQLDDAPELRTSYHRRHLAWIADLGGRWLDRLHDRDAAVAFATERANAIAALRRVPGLIDRRETFDAALRLGLAVRELHERRGLVAETSTLLRDLLGSAPQSYDRGLAARVRAEYGELLRRAGDPRGEEEVATAVNDAREASDDHALCRVLLIHAEILFSRGERDAGMREYGEAVEAATRADDPRLELDARQSYVVAKHFVGEFELHEHEAVHALALDVGDPWIEATCLTNIGIHLRDNGRVGDAIPRFETAIERFRDLGDEATAGHVMLFLGVSHLYAEDFDNARSVLEEAREILAHRGPEVRQMAEVALARVAVASGQFDRAEPLLAEIVRQAEHDQAVETEALARIERYYIACARHDDDRIRQELSALPDPQRVRSFEVHQHARALEAAAADLDVHGTPALDELIDELAEEHAVCTFARLQRGVVRSLGGATLDLARLSEELEIDPMTRFGLRRWWRWLEAAERHAGPVMLVEPGCKRVRPPDGEWIDLSRKGRSRAVIRTLVEHRRANPGEALPPEAVFESAWPDTTIQHDSAMARVYTAISEIRKMGLADVIERTDVGYLIPAGVAIQED